MKTDPRHHPRVTGTAGVELKSREGRFICRARNLSLVGCYVEIKAALRSEDVEVVLQIPGQRERVSFPARVVRKDSRSDGTVGLALKFMNVDWTGLLGLARLVSPQLI